jgi:hypothetical protein
MFNHLYRSICSWGTHSKYRNLILTILGITVIGAGMVFVLDYKSASETISSIERKSYGKGSITEKLKIGIEGIEKEEELELTVSERQYTDEEIKTVFERVTAELGTLILGDNVSLDAVKTDLDLITVFPDEPILIDWSIDRYDVMNIHGEIYKEAVQDVEEGILVELKAYIRYREDETKQMLHILHCQVYPPDYSAAEKIQLKIRQLVDKEEETASTESSVQLPGEVEGKQISYHRSMETRSFVILGLGISVSVLLVLLEKQKEKEEKQKRLTQMERDYAEIISKLTLLLGAGMTVKSVWKKIVEDYERQKPLQGSRFAYEEMANTYREMQSGVPETECYEHFGKNCGLRSYRKMGVLLSQNLRKGTKGLTDLLAIEAVAAYEERKTRAKRRGEEAGTKLLLPMFLMLGVVLVIVIVPAFLSIRV